VSINEYAEAFLVAACRYGHVHTTYHCRGCTYDVEYIAEMDVIEYNAQEGVDLLGWGILAVQTDLATGERSVLRVLVDWDGVTLRPKQGWK
jgi:hypothetical protein